MSRRLAYLSVGWIGLVLGLIGALLPILPTVPFLILAAWAFSNSSPRFAHWLYGHPRFGQQLRAWRDHRVISPLAKLWAVSAMAASVVIAGVLTANPWVVAVQGAVLGAVAFYLVTRPGRLPPPMAEEEPAE